MIRDNLTLNMLDAGVAGGCDRAVAGDGLSACRVYPSWNDPGMR